VDCEHFLEIAASAGIDLDLIIIDNQMGMRCLELANQHGIPALIMDGFQLANELTFQVARHFNRNNRAVSEPEADWEISTSADGDALQVLGLSGRKKVQDLFVDRKVPRERRHMVPVVAHPDGRIVWVAGHALGEPFRVSEATKSVVVLNFEPFLEATK